MAKKARKKPAPAVEGTKAIEQLKGYGVAVDFEDGYTRLSSDLRGFRAMVDGYKSHVFRHDMNTRMAKQFLVSDSEQHFCGGTVAQLHESMNGGQDMAPFLNARERFENSDLANRLRTELAECSPKRKRRYSDFDGDLDFQRMAEGSDTPFQVQYRTNEGVTRFMEIDCNFSISCGTSSEEIDAYGAMIWALSDLVESCGIMTRIVYRDKLSGFTGDGQHSGEVIVILKEPNEYVQPSVLASCFTSNFYRRVVFAGVVMMAEALGKEVKGSLGTCVHESAAIRFHDGRLILAPNVPQVQSAIVEREVLKAVRPGMPS